MAPTDEFCGIDPGEMSRMAADLRDASAGLTAFCAKFERRLGANGVGTAALREISEIAEWGRGQVSALHDRADLIQALNGGDDRAFVSLPGDLESFETARGLARMYGHDIFVNFSGELQAGLIHEHADEVARLAGDPQAAAAFFALLPPHIRDSLATRIARTGSGTAKADLAAFGKALGAALSAPPLVPAFTKVRNDLLKPADKATAWNRLALLQGVSLPAAVRGAAARSLALDGFTKAPRQDWRGAGPVETRAYDLSPDLVALGLGLLAGDGAAARDAFAKMGGADVKLGRADKMKQILDYALTIETGDDVAAAFGRAVQAGTGATTERPGHHSPAAAAFALDTILAAGSLGEKLPEAARGSMSTIAKSYVHELASGGRFDKAVYRTSGMSVPDNWIAVPGVTPAFYLSPRDTFGFLRTFAGDKRLTDDFDTAMARFRHDTLTTAARLDAQKDDGRFERAARMFGDVGALEFKAAVEIRGEKDATDDLIRGVVQETAALGIDGIPVADPVISAGWELAKAYGAGALFDKWNDSLKTRVEELTGERSDFALRQKYDLARLLYEAGYPTSEPPAEITTGSPPKIDTYEEITNTSKREASINGRKWEDILREKLIPYEQWTDENDRLDIKAENASRFHTNEQAKELMKIWGRSAT
ncbi:hypothetical protein ACFFMN_26435 [Planobispora siamensis]|uniref:Uncharacterized protein n=1 Tax=Planobispora siamensis TaxID=936338 RepID=A0A8J3WKG2_9ACTN|nr:hypothetical protein [Planobispora siamensis]GIH90796.1 hypothetical protein Psi01_14260 [Planobispora siamensis]